MRSLRIGVRLLVCFAIIVGLMIVGALITASQLQVFQSQAHQVDVGDQEVIRAC